MANAQAYKAALEWHLDNGVDEALDNEPAVKSLSPAGRGQSRESGEGEGALQINRKPDISSSPNPLPAGERASFLGRSDARAESEKLAAAASTLEELRETIAAFDGIALKKTATNMVFCDGNPQAPVMLVGEAPGADEDRLGKPFVGVSGQLLDRILKCINLDRKAEDPAQAIYISNILNWRPPGNRTPSPAEIDVSLPFIEKHIALVKPKLLILCGGVSAQALLNTEQSVSRLRGKWHGYKPSSPFLKDVAPITAIATYHPAYLLRTPSQKKAVWQDMLALQTKYLEIGQKT
ncbi:MAG: uracil-DNA glycosylase [Alphaproteobacteria bacterium PRO2]|nr:uracil-DNA glycosylase [Alphaproteobacteria bacterium PRO2]